MSKDITFKIWTVCMVQNEDEILLDRQHDNFKGFIPPGGKVEFPAVFRNFQSLNVV